MIIPARLGGLVASAILAAPILLAQPAAPDTALQSLLARLGEYALRYEASVPSLVAEEEYEQRYFTPHETRPTSTRSLRSEVLIVRLPLDVHWLLFRDVLAVDGHPVTDERGRLERLFRDSPTTALQKAQVLLRESARYNIGPIERNFNVPTLALIFLLPENQHRLTFSRTKTAQLARRKVAVLMANETARPTLIRSTGADTPVTATYWVDPDSGGVVQTELRFVSPAGGSRVWLRSEFAWDEKEQLWLPAAMSERYDLHATAESVDSRYYVEGHASYGKVRRIDVSVTTEEHLKAP